MLIGKVKSKNMNEATKSFGIGSLVCFGLAGAEILLVITFDIYSVLLAIPFFGFLLLACLFLLIFTILLIGESTPSYSSSSINPPANSPPVPQTDTTKQIKRKIEECCALVKNNLQKNVVPPTFTGFFKSDAYSGMSESALNRISINEWFLTSPDATASMLNEVIPHEFAHSAAYQIYGSQSNEGDAHGIFWQNVMKAIGQDPYKYLDELSKDPSMKKCKA